MKRIKCYQQTLGEDFRDCMKAVLEEVRAKRRSVVLLCDGLALTVTKDSTEKSVLHEYMIKSNRKQN